MATGFRIATDVPWDTGKPDWGRRFKNPAPVVTELMKRANDHQSKGFKTREAGEDWTKVVKYPKLDEHVTWQIEHDFKVGDVLHINALVDNVRWLIRKVELPDLQPPIAQTEGDEDVDFNHGLIFSDPDFRTVESWGIRNDRFIAGTTSPSMHWARTDSREGGRCTARAEDFGGTSSTTLWAVARKIAANGHAGSILWQGNQWTPESGEFRYIGSRIDHYDHVHAESRNASGSLC